MLGGISTARETHPWPGITSEGAFVTIIAGSVVAFGGDPFWDPVPFSWPLLLILVAICLLLTLGFIVWLVVQPDEPENSTKPLVDKAVRHDRESAVTVRRRLDADSGRADPADPELR